MAFTLPTSGLLSIKSGAGVISRSIAQVVDGNLTGDKNLLTLGNTAFGLSETPHKITDFYGYSGGSGTSDYLFLYEDSTRLTLAQLNNDLDYTSHAINLYVGYSGTSIPNWDLTFSEDHLTYSTTPPAWVSVTPTSGSGEDTLSISIQQYNGFTERTVYIKIDATGFEFYEVGYTQYDNS